MSFSKNCSRGFVEDLAQNLEFTDGKMKNSLLRSQKWVPKSLPGVESSRARSHILHGGRFGGLLGSKCGVFFVKY